MVNIRTTSVAVLVDREVDRNLRTTSTALLIDRTIDRLLEVPYLHSIIDAELDRLLTVSATYLIIDCSEYADPWHDILNQIDAFTVAHYAVELSNGSTILANALNNSDLSFTVIDGSVFPVNAPFDINIEDEIMRVTRIGNTLYARSRPAAAAHDDATLVVAVLTAEGLHKTTTIAPVIQDFTGWTWKNKQTITTDGRIIDSGSYATAGYWYLYKDIQATFKAYLDFKATCPRDAGVTSYGLICAFALIDTVNNRCHCLGISQNGYGMFSWFAWTQMTGTDWAARSNSSYGPSYHSTNINQLVLFKDSTNFSLYYNETLIYQFALTYHLTGTFSANKIGIVGQFTSVANYTPWQIEILRCEGF